MYIYSVYNQIMIKSFANKNTQKIYNQVFTKKIPHELTIVFYRKDLIMDMFINTPEVGEILVEEFMKPLGLSAYKLANDIHVPVSRIQDIIHNRRRISADTSLRLAKYFGLSANYFLNIQTDLDLRKANNTIRAEIEEIIPYKKTISV